MKKDGIKKEIIKICIKLKDLGFMPGASGNVSVKSGDIILITPTSVSKDELKIKDISEIDINGNTLNGITPSSEYKMHLEIYKTRKDISAIIHSHPPYSIAYTLSKKKINYNITAEFNMVIKKIGICKYLKPSSYELAVDAGKKSKYSNAIVLKNHGIVCTSDTLKNAMIITEELENFFKINYLCSLL
ncbi:MAG: class II aldolase/adducin family protein [Elusimicrobiales bacterium]|jgi:L-fuculose-phosphate aldolase|nr:class II aldolase/adducin family protein [Elusimicrobiales bacterium]